MFRDGRSVEMALGTIASPEITISGSYATWERIHKGEAGMVGAALTRGLKVKTSWLKGAVLAARYRGLFKMNDVIASIPTEFPSWQSES